MSFDLLLNKQILGIIAIILTFFAFVPYIFSILAGKTKPHIFSWIIWGITTCIVFFAQIADGGGAGAWSIGISGLITLYIAWLAHVYKSDHSATKSDWAFLIMALLSVPLWYLTSDPLSAVLILTFIDTVGLLPTIRKAYIKPFEEQILLYVMMSIRNIVAIIALEHYSLTTILFPAAITFGCMVLIPVIVVRRAQEKQSLKHNPNYCCDKSLYMHNKVK